jgi:hypothetical protein
MHFCKLRVIGHRYLFALDHLDALMADSETGSLPWVAELVCCHVETVDEVFPGEWLFVFRSGCREIYGQNMGRHTPR